MPARKVIDLRSDTVTRPTPSMRRAMAEAEVGDDVWGEDPTVRRLERMAAERMGKEAGLFTASGTMSNLVALLTWCRRGEEVILGDRSHIYLYEVGGASALGGIVYRPVPNREDGTLPLEEVERALRPENIHFPRTRLVCLENTHNRCSGAVLTPEYTRRVADLAHRHGLSLHLDGARLFNAAVALGVPPADLAGPADSVCFSLSKGLGAPIGSVLCGSEAFIREARRWRKMVGGGMRQVGVIAAAGIVALEEMVDRLAEDHRNARRLAEGLARIPGILLDPSRIQTNIVIFRWQGGPVSQFLKALEEQGVLASHAGEDQVRMVTHYHIGPQDIDDALEAVARAVRALLGASV